MDAEVIGFRILDKAYSLDAVKSLQQSLADAVHPVHYPAVAADSFRL
jgi:hypothetical protein